QHAEVERVLHIDHRSELRFLAPRAAQLVRWRQRVKSQVLPRGVEEGVVEAEEPFSHRSPRLFGNLGVGLRRIGHSTERLERKGIYLALDLSRPQQIDPARCTV